MTGQRATLELSGVGQISVYQFRSDVVSVVAPKPLPPGTRVTLEEADSASPLAQGKVISTTAIEGSEPRRWQIDIKLFAPTRSTRSRLVQLAK